MLSERADGVVQTLIELAAARGVTPAQMAVAWVLDHPEVTAPIVGTRVSFTFPFSSTWNHGAFTSGAMRRDSTAATWNRLSHSFRGHESSTIVETKTTSPVAATLNPYPFKIFITAFL